MSEYRVLQHGTDILQAFMAALLKALEVQLLAVRTLDRLIDHGRRYILISNDL